jgi:hypothetical protein
MSDQPNNRPNLGEISHLFLSSVRDRQTNGAPRPTRVPPGKKIDVSVDLTPEEFAQMSGGSVEASSNGVRKVPVTAVLASHLNGSQFDRVKQYARHLVGRVGRVGLIEIDASEFRLMSFEPADPEVVALGEATPTEGYDLSHVAEAMTELNYDVDAWLVLLPSPRTPEARAILRQVNRWVLLATCDHDGVVSCYRTLKGLADLHQPGEGEGSAGIPALTLATFGDDDVEADRVFQKLSSVCKQFLNWPIEREPRIAPADNAVEHLLMCVRPTRDKAQMASATQWEIVGKFVSSVQTDVTPKTKAVTMTETITHAVEGARHVADIPMGAARPGTSVAPVMDPFKTAEPDAPAMKLAEPEPVDEVVDLTGSDASAGSILSAIVRHEAGGLIECPVRPPMCPEARLGVDRQRGLVLLAVSRTGLADLKLIGQAYRWLIENRPLISMAVPQMSIDAHQLPRLRLIVDQSDLSADTLQPLVHSGNVIVQAYRKLRWNGRTGLLLQQAA